MQKQANNILIEAGIASDDEYAQEHYVDIHCHCLPGLDDGPATMSESLALCRALVNENITTVVATPHQLGQFSECNGAAQVREAVSALNEELKSNDIALAVLPGADVRVDERTCKLLKEDKILTLADGGKYILLELPHYVLIDIEPLLADLGSMGIQSIISHPERHPGLTKEPDILAKWLECPAHLQVTAGSLLGCFGSATEKFGWGLLDSCRASFVATDCHNLNGRRPCMKAAFKRISDRLGETVARLVCIENPLRVLKGQDIADYSLSTRMRRDGEKQGSFRKPRGYPE
jgi:protein-tyrosine phosphatase